ncbi:hypothetical protein HYT24_00730 [Candidatus Pacearchaeota archaeon]|nr:hypothetical protein [Candidatus Pacearchaeota archaeon]
MRLMTVNHARAKPGTRGGNFYRIVLRPKEQFTSFRIQDVGRKGHAERLAGRRRSGSWATQAWLINKKDAHIEDGRLVPDDLQTKRILNRLSTTPKHVKGNIFKAKDRKNIPEKQKPTKAQMRARRKNIKKAQRARMLRRFLE